MMKYVKIIGLMAIAATALMALAATASATTLTSPSGTTCTSTIEAMAEGSVSIDGPFTTVTCKQPQIVGKVEAHGSSVTAGGNLSTQNVQGLKFTECNFEVFVENPGSIAIHPVKVNGTTVEACSGTNCTGTLASTGVRILINTSIGAGATKANRPTLACLHLPTTRVLQRQWTSVPTAPVNSCEPSALVVFFVAAPVSGQVLTK